MKLIPSFFLFISLIINAVAFGQQKQPIDKKFDAMLSRLLKHSVSELTPNEITADVIFLDAREKEEFNVSHIPNAILIGYNNFDITKWLHLSKKTPIVVYCSVGYRSEKIAEQFKKFGYNNVSNLYGGIFEWKHQNRTLFKNNTPTDSIHTYNKEWSQWLQKGIKVY